MKFLGLLLVFLTFLSFASTSSNKLIGLYNYLAAEIFPELSPCMVPYLVPVKQEPMDESMYEKILHVELFDAYEPRLMTGAEVKVKQEPGINEAQVELQIVHEPSLIIIKDEVPGITFKVEPVDANFSSPDTKLETVCTIKSVDVPPTIKPPSSDKVSAVKEAYRFDVFTAPNIVSFIRPSSTSFSSSSDSSASFSEPKNTKKICGKKWM